MSTSMEGKVVLVTGATSGIGKATAAGLAKLGAIVVLVARNREKGIAVRDEIRATSNNTYVEQHVGCCPAGRYIKGLKLR